MDSQPSKAVKEKIRALAGRAYERELTEALSALEREFARWRAGELDPFELSERIHRFHDGEGRELYKAYVLGEPDLSLPYAIARGVVSDEEAGAEVMRVLEGKVKFFRERL